MLDIQNGADHKAVETDHGFPVIGSGGPFAFASTPMFDGESVLLGRKGTIDKPLYVRGPFWTVDTMYWSKIEEGTSARFAYYVATTIPFGYYSTNTALPSMTKSLLNAHLVPLPHLSEQQVIAAFLDRETAKIDALIAEQEKLIALLAEKRQATISHAVTKGLNPDVPMKDSGVPWLGEVPAHWEINRLKSISPQITVGIVVEPSKYYVGSGVPALRSLNVAPGRVIEDNFVFISAESNDLLSKSRLRAGDLVSVRSGQTGTTAVVPENLNGCNCIDLIIIRKPRDDSEQFLCWFLGSDAAIQQFSSGSGGAIQQHFNIGTAMNLQIARPPRKEQDAIVKFLEIESDKIESLHRASEHSINLLQERRSALIAAAVTGQIDVRGLY